MDPITRRHVHGRVRPMEEPRCGLWCISLWIAATLLIVGLAAFLTLS